MKIKSIIFYLLFLSIFGQNYSDKAIINLKCGTLHGETPINQYFTLVKDYILAKKNKNIEAQELQQKAKELFDKFLYIDGLTYNLSAEEAKIFLLETNKKEERILIKVLQSANKIQQLQLKQREGQFIKQQIDELKNDSSKKEEKDKLEEKLKKYQKEMFKNFGILSDKTYQMATTKLSIYIVTNYEELKYLRKFKNLSKKVNTQE